MAEDGTLLAFARHADFSWLSQLEPDPETEDHYPNKTSRQVKSGHYVVVRPTPLPKPTCAIASENMLTALGMTLEEAKTERFASFFSGGGGKVGGSGEYPSKEIKEMAAQSWCTPYALSIYGQEMVGNCPFKNGNGYGDGRAISVAEVLIPSSIGGVHTGQWLDAASDIGGATADGSGAQRWELQLKGGGTTPFARGADGRAVLRSSVREFLASEAMHALGVSTTRALSLVISGEEKVQRPWYSNSSVEPPSLDDPRLARFPLEMRKMLIQQFMEQGADPDIMVDNVAAITTRVATSFTRVGHIELFARRARGMKSHTAMIQLQQIVDHVMLREYPAETETSEFRGKSCEECPAKLLCFLTAAVERFGKLAASWIRVGFCQGNFNSDNCLVGGRTMDFGPFGFIEKYQRNWNMWSGGGDHFSFMNQPSAAFKNFETLANAVLVLFEKNQDGSTELAIRQLVSRAEAIMHNEMHNAMRQKLGLSDVSWTQGGGSELWRRLETLLHDTAADWTLFWRELPCVLEVSTAGDQISDDELVAPLLSPRRVWYSEGSGVPMKDEFVQWFRDWVALVSQQTTAGGAAGAAKATAAGGAGAGGAGAGGAGGGAGGCSPSGGVGAAAARDGFPWAGQGVPDDELQQGVPNVCKSMRMVNPKYVPREWMLVNAYTLAMKGQFEEVHRLHGLFNRPFDDQGREIDELYYRVAPAASFKTGGTAFMS
jgi:uncharacterized protein YdiU (UPF0061 family)